MLSTLLITILIVAIAFSLLGIGIWVKGRFPNLHISGNKALTDKGIYCVQAQDEEARSAAKGPFAHQKM